VTRRHPTGGDSAGMHNHDEKPGRSHGVDVNQYGHGVLRDGRMYQLARQHDAVRREQDPVGLDHVAGAWARTP
jgi:hypothetical protein